MHFYFSYFVSKVNKFKFFQMMQEIQKISSLTERQFSYLILLTLKSIPIIQVATSTKIILCYVWIINTVPDWIGKNFTCGTLTEIFRFCFPNLWQRWPPLCSSKQETLKMKTGSQKNKMGILFSLSRLLNT